MSGQVEQLEDAFLKVSFEEEPAFPASKPTVEAKFPGRYPQVYPQWIQHTSSDRHDDEVWMVNALRKAYPGHHIVPTYNLSTLNFPDVLVMPSEDDESIIRAAFIPLARSSEIPGLVLKQPVYATYTVFWKEFEFKAVVIEYPVTWSTQTELFLVHKGSEATVHELIVAAGAYGEELHGQIWVYDNGWWDKDAALYEEVQKANWDDVILKPAYKAQIQGEISGFYGQKQIYKDLGIPWKRGLIFHGPPGNGKSISMKAIMKGVPAVPLYVRNFNHWGGPEAAMKMVFGKARQNSPSLLILEDLDALITPQTRSFFLNQIDGLDNNDGILIIGTTNYLERIDPALSKRPSRFDRKLLFDNPDHEERILYCKYWQNKLASNKELDFPDELLTDIADNTDKFSFAFLKEVFVNTLVKLATGSETNPFPKAIMRTIKELRDQIDTEVEYVPASHTTPQVTFAPPPGPPPGLARSFHTHFRRLMEQ